MSVTRTNLPTVDVHVEPGRNHRSEQDLAAGLEPLRDSVARRGVLQPLLVRPREAGGVWLVAGHRRLAAAQAAELADVPLALVDGGQLELSRPSAARRRRARPEEVVARSARQGRFRPRPEAEKALARICRKHLPPSLKRFAAEVAEREAGAKPAPAPPRSTKPTCKCRRAPKRRGANRKERNAIRHRLDPTSHGAARGVPFAA